jgi:hypothetical protein
VESPELVTGLQSLYKNVNAPIIGATAIAKQRKDMFKYLPGLEFFRKNPREFWKRMRKTTKFISGGYLYHSFGVAPLVSDMRKLSKSVGRFKRQIEEGAKRSGEQFTVHVKTTGKFRQTLKPGITGLLPTAYGSDPSQYVGHWHAVVDPQQEPTKIVTITGTRSLRFDMPIFKKLDYLLNRFGSGGPASYAWERIPFSFVVDWFVDLSSVIHSIDSALTGSSKKVTDACISTKWACNVASVLHPYAANVTSIYTGKGTSLSELSSYTRTPFTPTITVGLSGRFGKKQGSLTAALLAQMCANLRRKR